MLDEIKSHLSTHCVRLLESGEAATKLCNTTMSRVGKKIIQIPEGVEVKVEKGKVSVKGPKGELAMEFRPEIKVEVEEKQIKVSPVKEVKETSALWGLTQALISNMVDGVTKGFEKKLEIQGIGFRAEVTAEGLVLHVGFSHAVNMKIPEGVKITVEKNIVTVSGTDKGLVGQVAANIRKVKKPEPYKGKGIRYLGEQVRRKVGKKVMGSTGAK